MKTCPQCSTGYPDSHTTCATSGVLLNKMHKGKRTGWLLALLIGVTVLPALSQQEEGPILLPKPKPVAKPVATLLVMCDLACNWKLDGKPLGRFAAGDSVTAPLSMGPHIIDATTLDGLDEVKKEIEIKTNGQMNVHIALQAVQATRLKADQEARDKAARELAAVAWIDPATGLMWTKKDNGSNVTWQQAMDYCRNLQLAGHSDWRLPTIDELQGIYDPNANVDGWHVKGNLQLSAWHWSSSQGTASGEAWAFAFNDEKRASGRLGNSSYLRALCVRRSGE